MVVRAMRTTGATRIRAVSTSFLRYVNRKRHLQNVPLLCELRHLCPQPHYLGFALVRRQKRGVPEADKAVDDGRTAPFFLPVSKSRCYSPTRQARGTDSACRTAAIFWPTLGTVTETLVCRLDFPKAIRLPLGNRRLRATAMERARSGRMGGKISGEITERIAGL